MMLPSQGSRTAAAEQVQHWMPSQKCSAAWTWTGWPIARAVPIALVPVASSLQLTPGTSRILLGPLERCRVALDGDDEAARVGEQQDASRVGEKVPRRRHHGGAGLDQGPMKLAVRPELGVIHRAAGLV